MGKRHQAVQGSAQLDAQLSGYSAIARISATAGTFYRRTGNWPIYAAATGSALAMATGASASLITSGIVSGVYPGGESVNPGGPNTQLGLIPGLSVKIHALSSAAGPTVQLQLQASNENIFFSQVFTDIAKNFGFESPIAPVRAGGGGHTEDVKAFFSSNVYGNFLAGMPGFIGLSFSAGGGNTDYGWIELKFTNNGGGVPYYLDALAFGINTNTGQTPGTLLAGEIDGGFIPEPGTLSLALLASGAAGVMALRRRRKQAAN